MCVPTYITDSDYIIPDACIGDTVAVETATRGTEVGPMRGTYVNKEKQKIINN